LRKRLSIRIVSFLVFSLNRDAKRLWFGMQDLDDHPVKFSRLTETGDPDQPRRRRIFDYVARLVKVFAPRRRALAVNETDFIHADFTEGKRVLVWKSGGPSHDPVAVVANFSNFVTANAGTPNAEYRVPNWPVVPPGRQRAKLRKSAC
jgi:pullulanase